MTNVALHWRCGRPLDAHSDWCSDGTANDCTHCGGDPCRWWCLGEDGAGIGSTPYPRRQSWTVERPARLLEPA